MHGLILAAAALSEVTLLRMGPMPVEPVIDNTITVEEAEAASTQYGAISTDNGLMAMRYAVFHIGYTAKGFYFATRTSIPQLPQTLTDEDVVELILQPAAASSRPPYRYTFKLAEKARILKGVKDYGERCCEFETLIPYGELPQPQAGEKWGFNMSVTFSSEKETAYFHLPSVKGRETGDAGHDVGELATLVIDPTAPTLSLVNFYTLEQWRQSGSYRFLFRYANNSQKPVPIVSKTRLARGVHNAKLDSDAEKNVDTTVSSFGDAGGFTLAPGENKEMIHIEWVIWAGKPNTLALDFESAGKKLFKRTLAWDGVYHKKWVDAKGLPSLKTAFFPSSNNRLRMKYFPGRIGDLVAGSIEVRGTKADKVWWRQELKPAKDFLRGETFDINLPGLTEDDYTVTFEAKDRKGESYRHVRTFQVKSFPWQTAEVGMDRVIVPPFKAIKVEKWNGGKVEEKISFLQTGYRCGGVLWDEIYGRHENLLAAPIKLTLNGQEFTVTGTKILEQADDRVVREVTAEIPLSTSTSSLHLTVTQTYDYDGFCWTTFAFDAPEPVEVKNLKIAAPLRSEFAKYFEVQRRIDRRAGPAPDFTLKGGEGEVWNSLMNVDNKWWYTQFPASIQPYFWFGGAFKGLAWIMDGVRDLSLDRDLAPQRVIRRGKAAVYEIDLVNKPVVWKGRKTFEMGWQPTPVRPQDPSHGAFASLMYRYACPSNAVHYALEFNMAIDAIHAPDNTYPGDDRSFYDWVRSQKTHIDKPYDKWDCTEYRRRLKAYIDKHKDWFAREKSTSATDYWYGKLNNARGMGVDLSVRYLDPMLVTSFWPEWEMYKSEWYPEEWTHDDYFNEYMAHLCKTRIDKLMWDGKVALENGADGLYYDCYRIASSWNLGCKDVYLRADGTIQMNLGNILAWRDIMKRSATVCYKMGKMYNGRPVVEDHDTNGHIVPTMSWAMTALSTERGSDGGEFPDRFPESYTLAEITGGQTGKGARFIVSTNKGDLERQNRELISLMAYMCAYGMFSLSDQWIAGDNARFEAAWNRVFDFGWGKREVKQYRYWNEYQHQPVTHTGRDIRLTVAKKRGQALLLFGNLGGATEISFDIAGLGFGEVTFTDAETGAAIDAPGGKVSDFKIARHDFRQVLVTETRRAEPIPVALTFDDGCHGQLSVAEPMLAARGWKGTFNIVTGWPSGTMSWDEIRELRRRGHEIASHSIDHPRMVTLLDEGKTNEVVRQLRESADKIQREVGVRPVWFCAPYIQQNEELDRLARKEGMRVMTIRRIPFGGKHPPDKAYGRTMDAALAKNPKALDFLIHGITLKEGGWGPFDDEKDFADFLDAIAEREAEGRIRVVPYAEAYRAFAGE